VAVVDTGIGIPAETLPTIFVEFQQVDQPGATAREVTGLGLAIARRSVELLGGTIDVDSEVDVGTTFTIHLTDLDTES